MAEKIKEEVIVEEIKPYTFRKLDSKDLFLMTKLVKKIGLNNIGKCFDGDKVKEMANGGADVTQIGISVMFDIVQVVIEALDNIENELFELLEATSNLNRKEIETMDLDVFIEMLFDFFKLESFQKVFTKVVSLLS